MRAGAQEASRSALPAAAITPQPASAPCDIRIPEDFTPMTRTERAAEYLNSLIGPRAVVFTVLRAGFNQGLSRPEEWDQGWRGLGYRLASGYGQHAIDVSFVDGIAFGLDEDNRYFNSGEEGFGRRLHYALASSFLARHDNGSRSVSVSALAGPAVGAALSRFWQPGSTRSAQSAVASYGISIGFRVGMNVAREFAPRFVRRLIQ